MSEWSVYLIRCRTGQLYTGITTDVKRRFQEHQTNNKLAAKYLKNKRPLKLVFQKVIGNRSEASKVEYHIKRLPKEQKEQMVNGEVVIEKIIDMPNKENS